jgi:hypothetical protein
LLGTISPIEALGDDNLNANWNKEGKYYGRVDAVPILFGLLIMGLAILFAVFWFIALIDILKSEFTGSNKIIWLLVMLFVPPIGLLAYHVFGKNQKVSMQELPK